MTRCGGSTRIHAHPHTNTNINTKHTHTYTTSENVLVANADQHPEQQREYQTAFIVPVPRTSKQIWSVSNPHWVLLQRMSTKWNVRSSVLLIGFQRCLCAICACYRPLCHGSSDKRQRQDELGTKGQLKLLQAQLPSTDQVNGPVVLAVRKFAETTLTRLLLVPLCCLLFNSLLCFLLNLDWDNDAFDFTNNSPSLRKDRFTWS